MSVPQTLAKLYGTLPHSACHISVAPDQVEFYRGLFPDNSQPTPRDLAIIDRIYGEAQPHPVSDFDQVLNACYEQYTTAPEEMYMPLSYARDLGFDVSEAPQGSICRITAKGCYFVVPEDCP
jgi:hypothetical protein